MRSRPQNKRSRIILQQTTVNAAILSSRKIHVDFREFFNPEIENKKELTKNCEDTTQRENDHLKITVIIVRVTKANIRTKRVRDHA